MNLDKLHVVLDCLFITLSTLQSFLPFSTQITRLQQKNSSIFKLIWNELYSAWKLWNQDWHCKEEELQRQIKQTNVGPISSTTSLQPHQSPKVVLRQPQLTLPLETIIDTASKLGHHIWLYDPSMCSHPTTTQPTGPHGNWWGLWTLQFTGTLGPIDPSLANTDVRTFVPFMVWPWHLKPNGAPSFGSVLNILRDWGGQD
jgi:hypothetical protein